MRGRSRKALLILDMISEFRFQNWKPCLRAAQRIAPAIARLRQRAVTAGLPVIHVNDADDDWQSDRSGFLHRCAAPGARGRDIAKLLAPQATDAFLFKPRHSAFYATPLSDLLEKKGIEELVVTGSTMHQCVLFTAVDAYVRDYRLVTPRDCLAASSLAQRRHALFILEDSLRSLTTASTSIRFSR